jgi:hypothetical protein
MEYKEYSEKIKLENLKESEYNDIDTIEEKYWNLCKEEKSKKTNKKNFFIKFI